MADMDSPSARNRQAPATVRRNTAPPKPKPAVSGHPTQRKPKYKTTKPKATKSYREPARKTVYKKKIKASSSGGSKSVQKTAPRKPPPQTAKPIIPPAPPKPAPPSTGDYLKSDSVYQRQLAAYAKSLADFQADQGLAQTDYNTNYQNTYRDIGLAKQDAAESLKNDFASRGLLQSSLYNQGLGELNTQYQNQYTDLGEQKTSFLDQLKQEYAKYSNEQGTQKQNAMQEALRRRAEKYGL